jgi:hypothetical protein
MQCWGARGRRCEDFSLACAEEKEEHAKKHIDMNHPQEGFSNGYKPAGQGEGKKGRKAEE